MKPISRHTVQSWMRRSFAGTVLLAGCSSNLVTAVDGPPRTVAMVFGFDAAGDPDVDAMKIRWLLAGHDTVLSAVTETLPASSTAVEAANGESVFILSNTRTELRVIEVDQQTRSVVRRSTSRRFAPVVVATSEGETRIVSPVIGFASPVLISSLGLIVTPADDATNTTPGLLAISVATLKPIWFLPGRSVVATATDVASTQPALWVSVRHAGRFDGVGGSLIRLDLRTFAVLDSLPFPGRTSAEAMPLYLSMVAADASTVLAGTSGALFQCSRSPLSCEPTATNVSGILSPLRQQAAYVQSVSNPRLLLARGPVAILSARGAVIRTIAPPEFSLAAQRGVISARSDGRGTSLVVLAGPESSEAPSDVFPIRLAIVNVANGELVWQSRLTTAGRDRPTSIF